MPTITCDCGSRLEVVKANTVTHLNCNEDCLDPRKDENYSRQLCGCCGFELVRGKDGWLHCNECGAV